jgi:hypothetical protein
MRKTLPFAAAMTVLAACRQDQPIASYELVVRVSGDPRQPLSGAAVSFRGTEVGKTGNDGTVLLSIEGTEGETLNLDVGCPNGFRSPTKPVQILLRRLADPSQRPEYSVACPPTMRTVVVAVRAEGGPSLPVMYLGQEIARTDASGAAHAVVKVAPEEAIELVLGTQEPGHERLRPQNPSTKFLVKNQDDLFAFDVRFTVEPPPAAPRVRRSPPQPKGPVRLN